MPLWWTLRRARSDDPETRADAIRKLPVTDDPRVIAAYVSALDSSNTEIRAVAALSRIGPPAVEPLVAAIRRDPPKAKAAAQALGAIRDPRAVDALLELLGDGPASRHPRLHWETKPAAIEALGQIGDARAVEPLAELLPRYAKQVCAALAALGDARAVPALVSALRRPSRGPELEDWRKRRQDCVGALIALGTPSVEAVLPWVFGDRAHRDADERESAAHVLRGVGWKPADEASRAELLVAARAYREAAALGAVAAPALLWALREVPEGGAAEALVALGEPVVEPLIRTLEDRDPKVRLPAARVLARIGARAALGPLFLALRNTQGIEQELSRIDSGWKGTREVAQAMPEMRAALRRGPVADRKGALRVLRSMGWTPADDRERSIEAALAHEWSTADGVQQGARTFGESAVEILAAVVTDGSVNEYARGRAAYELGRLRDGRAAGALVAYARGPRAAPTAIEALAAILETSAHAIPLADLKLMASLEDLTFSVEYTVDYGGGEGRWHRKNVKTSSAGIRAAAQAELERRALPPS